MKRPMLTLQQLKEEVFLSELQKIEDGIMNALRHCIDGDSLTVYVHYNNNDDLRKGLENALIMTGYQLIKGNRENTICVKL